VARSSINRVKPPRRALVAAPALTRPLLEVTTDLFQASVDLRLPDGTTQRWNIRQDALVWPD
jgi:hypothetical protein